MSEKVVLAYSGGLDTSVAIRWLQETYGMEVITLTVDLGGEQDVSSVAARARQIGAVKAVVVDARLEFMTDFVWPALQAGAIHEHAYPLEAALARPLIAKHLIDVARSVGASAVAHGCTGKGNDQIRFDVSVMALAPDLRIIAPVREWKLTRDAELEYAHKHGIPLAETATNSNRPYSVDANLWGRNISSGVLDDPWIEPPTDVWQWTSDPATTPATPEEITITFERGLPLALNGMALDAVALVQRLNLLAGAHGVGRIDHVENRLVGIKAREVYEVPAATVLHAAHRALESLTLSREQARIKDMVAVEYARLIYNGLWFTALNEDIMAFVRSSQRFVSGDVRVKLYRGACTIVGRRSPYALYEHALATYERGDVFDHRSASGFIALWSLPVIMQARVQLYGNQHEEARPMEE